MTTTPVAHLASSIREMVRVLAEDIVTLAAALGVEPNNVRLVSVDALGTLWGTFSSYYGEVGHPPVADAVTDDDDWFPMDDQESLDITTKWADGEVA